MKFWHICARVSSAIYLELTKWSILADTTLLTSRILASEIYLVCESFENENDGLLVSIALLSLR